MSDELTLGRKLYALREDRKYSQSRLEVEADLSFGTISRIENGLINPTKETLVKLANSLKLSDREFRYLVSTRNSSPTDQEINALGELIIDEVNSCQFPCYITDYFGRIWFWNEMSLELYDIDRELAIKSKGINFIKVLIYPEFNLVSKIPKKYWPTFFKEQVMTYKKIMYTYRKEDFNLEEIRELETNKEFSNNWKEEIENDSLKISNTLKVIYDSQILDIEIITTTLLEDYRFLLVRYYPRDAITAKAFEKIRKIVGV